MSTAAAPSVTPDAVFQLATRTSPVMPALMSGEFLIQTLGRSYSAAEVRDWLAPSGWRFLEHRPLAGAVSLVVGEKS